MEVTVYQIDCKVYMLKSVYLSEMLLALSSFVDTALSKNEEMLKMHMSHGFKNYVISGFKEIEKSKIYLEGGLYTFAIRTVNQELYIYLTEQLKNASTDSLKGIVTNGKIIKKSVIQSVYTITPAIIKVQEGVYWRKKIGIEDYERRLKENLVKKWNAFAGVKMDEDFELFTNLKFLNLKPLSFAYKDGIHLLGDKFELQIAENSSAQMLAYFALGVGVHEMNGRGYGYLNYCSY